jgi:hypothetical protein
MADTKLSALTELAAAPATGDEVYIRDISESAADESKRITIANLRNGGVLDDTSPQLGGNLDMQARLLVGNGGSTGIAISANGEVTMAAQPSVFAYLGSTDSNVTGAGNVHTLGTDNALTEVFDQNSDFVTTGTFTAPVAGRYLIFAGAQHSGITTAADTIQGPRIVASNRNFHLFYWNLTNTLPATVVVGGGAIIDMDAADTFIINLRVSGESSDVVEIAASGEDTHIMVQLVA